MKRKPICTLEELGEEHDHSYREYDFSYGNEPTHLGSLFFMQKVDIYNHRSIMEWYNKSKVINMKDECDKLNAKKQGVSDIDTAHKIYVLKRNSDNKVLGSIDIHCSKDEYLKKVIPEISYEIRPDERGNHYGTLMFLLMLENNDVKVEKLYAKIVSSNTHSLKLIRHFNPKELGTTSTPLNTIIHFEVDNLAYQKTLHK